MFDRRTLMMATASAVLLVPAWAHLPQPVLLIGLDPDVVDFGKLPGNLNAAALRETLNGEVDKLRAHGIDARWCFIGLEPGAARAKVSEALQSAQFDAALVGAGVRLTASNTALFEAVVNTVHHHAPQARLCFSANAGDTTEAVVRCTAQGMVRH